MKNKLSCFISATTTFDLTKIENILNNLNIDHKNVFDIQIGSHISDLTRRELKKVDFVIAILENNNFNVMFELGVAIGLKKPVFIILVGKETVLPSSLLDELYFKTDFTDTKLLELALSKFTDNIKEKKNTFISKKVKETTLDKVDIDAIITNIEKLRASSYEADILHLLIETLSKLNIQNVSYETPIAEPNNIYKMADLMISSNNLIPFLGNPIFVELKSGYLSQDKIARAKNELINLIKHTDARGGIILYLDKNNEKYRTQLISDPLILIFDLEDFIRGIASEGFEKFLTRKRNELAHGKTI